MENKKFETAVGCLALIVLCPPHPPFRHIDR